MNDTKPDLQAMKRLLHRHQWTDPSEWGRAIGALADLSDLQIEAVAEPEDTAEPDPSGTTAGDSAG